MKDLNEQIIFQRNEEIGILPNRGYAPLRVLIACEESQAVCKAFRKLGHNAYSCDILPCSGGYPQWHFKMDVLKVIEGGTFPTQLGILFSQTIEKWDVIIGFPSCTFLTNAAAVRLRVNGKINQERMKKAKEAKKFFLQLLNSNAEYIALENPTPSKIHELPNYNQAIQPWMFGHKYTKRTCLWLKNLPKLIPNINEKPNGITPYVNGGCKDANGNYRKAQGRNERCPIQRSKTFEGIAEAMAAQWSDFILNDKRSNCA